MFCLSYTRIYIPVLHERNKKQLDGLIPGVLTNSGTKFWKGLQGRTEGAVIVRFVSNILLLQVADTVVRFRHIPTSRVPSQRLLKVFLLSSCV